MTSDTPKTKAPYLPPRWFVTTAWKVHRALYRISGGRFGLRASGPKRYGLARLTTTGRRTGQPRSVMIGYYMDDGAFVTMAMNGWGAPEPAWWLNLQADPSASLTSPDGTVEVTARAAVGAERERLWQRWRDIDVGLDDFAARRPQETAVVVLTPVSADQTPSNGAA